MIFKPKCPKCGSTNEFSAIADFEGEGYTGTIQHDDGSLEADGCYEYDDYHFTFSCKRFQCDDCQAEFVEPDKEPADDEARIKIAHEQSEKQGQTNFLTGANR